MRKDPAFLFYSSDFLTGVEFMAHEEIGQYILILCLLHQHGGCLPLEKIEKAVGNIKKNVLEKLRKNQFGYFNIRLSLEMKKRKNYSKSRRLNRLGKKKDKNTCKTYVKHMENRNRDTNKQYLKDKKTIKILCEGTLSKIAKRPNIEKVLDQVDLKMRWVVKAYLEKRYPESARTGEFNWIIER